MVFVFCGEKYLPMINKILTETDQVCAGREIGERQFFKKFVKENIAMFEQVEILILDLTALSDTDEEVLQGIESLRIVDYGTRFIIIAPYRREGDKMLKECFYAGIYDIIVTDEYLEMSRQLTQCVCYGMRYKDALRFRDVAVDEAPKAEAVRKVIVGVAGSGSRAGSTHNSIVIANYLRTRNQMTAVMEMNHTHAFQAFCEAYKAKLFDDGYFSINGVDYYPECDKKRVTAVSGKLYNFIVLDFGDYGKSDKVLYNSCDVRVMYTGTKPWELGGLEPVFEEQEEEVLKRYHFCFLGTTSNKLQKEIMEHMRPLENIFFPEYVEDPFMVERFPEGQAIFSEYLKEAAPGEERQKVKRGWPFGRRKGDAG